MKLQVLFEIKSHKNYQIQLSNTLNPSSKKPEKCRILASYKGYLHLTRTFLPRRSLQVISSMACVQNFWKKSNHTLTTYT